MRLKQYRLEIMVIVVVAVFTIIKATNENVSINEISKGIAVILLAIGMIGVQELWKNRK